MSKVDPQFPDSTLLRLEGVGCLSQARANLVL